MPESFLFRIRLRHAAAKLFPELRIPHIRQEPSYPPPNWVPKPKDRNEKWVAKVFVSDQASAFIENKSTALAHSLDHSCQWRKSPFDYVTFGREPRVVKQLLLLHPAGRCLLPNLNPDRRQYKQNRFLSGIGQWPIYHTTQATNSAGAWLPTSELGQEAACEGQIISRE